MEFFGQIVALAAQHGPLIAFCGLVFALWKFLPNAVRKAVKSEVALTKLEQREANKVLSLLNAISDKLSQLQDRTRLHLGHEDTPSLRTKAVENEKKIDQIHSSVVQGDDEWGVMCMLEDQKELINVISAALGKHQTASAEAHAVILKNLMDVLQTVQMVFDVVAMQPSDRDFHKLRADIKRMGAFGGKLKLDMDGLRSLINLDHKKVIERVDCVEERVLDVTRAAVAKNVGLESRVCDLVADVTSLRKQPAVSAALLGGGSLTLQKGGQMVTISKADIHIRDV